MLCIVAWHNVLCATDIVHARMFMPHDVECSRLDALSLFVLFYVSQGLERLQSAQTCLDIYIYNRGVTLIKAPPLVFKPFV